MAKQETFNLQFTALVTTNGRVTIPIEITDTAKIRQGDKITLCLKQVYKTEA